MDGRLGDAFTLLHLFFFSPGIEEERSFDDFTIPQNNEFGGGQWRHARLLDACVWVLEAYEGGQPNEIRPRSRTD